MTSIFIPAVLLAVLSSVLLMVYAIVKRTAEKSFFLIFLAVASCLYSFGYLMEIQAQSLEAAFYGVRVQYLGLPMMLPVSYLFVRDIYGEKRLSPAQAGLLMIMPIFTVLGVQAYPLLRVYYTGMEYISNGHIANCLVQPGPMYHLWTVYSYLMLVLILRQILKRLKDSAGRQRGRNISLLAAFLAPMLFSMPYILFRQTVRYDPVPIGTALSLALVLHAVGQDNLLNVVPLARVRVIEDMQDALIVCDNALNFLDANRAAKTLFPALRTFLPGDSMGRIPNFKYEGELWLAVEGRLRFFKVSQTRILDGTKDSGVCVVFHDITEKEQLLKKLHIQATFDPLLHVYNRATFFDMANLTLADEGAQKISYAVLMLDIDHFKPVNDTYGHPCGDIVLETIAVVVKGHFRKGDLVGRYGGEEIVVLLENLTSEQAVTVAEKLRQVIERTAIHCQEQTLYVTVSVGVAHSPAGGVHDLERMVAQADAALYRAKNSGRNKVCL